MDTPAQWYEYHRRCDEWTAKHGYSDERAFLDFVRRLTAELGL